VGDRGDEPHLLANLPAGTRTLAVRVSTHVLSSENVVISATAMEVSGQLSNHEIGSQVAQLHTVVRNNAMVASFHR
jgi:hypothetical protein